MFMIQVSMGVNKMDEAKPKIYQWIEEENKVKAPVETPRKTYDERLVAFIDVLGMREIIRNEENDAEDILFIMGQLNKYVESACEDLLVNSRLSYWQLGDGFIIVTNLDCLDKLCEILSIVQWLVLIDSKMLLRGAVTAGKVIMSEDSKLIIGPAYIEAFALESDNAIFPRIIIADEIQQFISSENITFKYIAEDNDKFKYIDFLNYIREVEDLNKVRLEHLLKTQGVLAFLKNSYIASIKKDKRVAQKYGWIISKITSYNINVV